MKIKIVKHYSVYDPDFEGEVGFVTIEVPSRTGLFGHKVDPVIQKFEEYGRESKQFEKAQVWVDAYVTALGKKVDVEITSVADDVIDRP